MFAGLAGMVGRGANDVKLVPVFATAFFNIEPVGANVLYPVLGRVHNRNGGRGFTVTL